MNPPQQCRTYRINVCFIPQILTKNVRQSVLFITDLNEKIITMCDTDTKQTLRI